jgi:hypothetical protein
MLSARGFMSNLCASIMKGVLGLNALIFLAANFCCENSYSTVTPVFPAYKWFATGVGAQSAYGRTPLESCQALSGAFWGGTPVSAPPMEGNAYMYYCNGEAPYTHGLTSMVQPTCPAYSILSGYECICAHNYYEVNGACIPQDAKFIEIWTNPMLGKVCKTPSQGAGLA